MSQTKIVVKRVQGKPGSDYSYFRVAKISNPKPYMLKDLDLILTNIDAVEKYVKERSSRDTVVEVLND